MQLDICTILCERDEPPLAEWSKAVKFKLRLSRSRENILLTKVARVRIARVSGTLLLAIRTIRFASAERRPFGSMKLADLVFIMRVTVFVPSRKSCRCLLLPLELP